MRGRTEDAGIQAVLPQLLGRHLEWRHLEAPQGHQELHPRNPRKLGRPPGREPVALRAKGDARQVADLERVRRRVSAVAPGTIHEGLGSERRYWHLEDVEDLLVSY